MANDIIAEVHSDPADYWMLGPETELVLSPRRAWMASNNKEEPRWQTT